LLDAKLGGVSGPFWLEIFEIPRRNAKHSFDASVMSDADLNVGLFSEPSASINCLALEKDAPDGVIGLKVLIRADSMKMVDHCAIEIPKK
jgi:hypothetical protein